MTFLSEPYRSSSYEIVIESNQPLVIQRADRTSFFCSKNARPSSTPSAAAGSISIFTLMRCSILLQTLQLVRARLTAVDAAAQTTSASIDYMSQRRRNRIYERERRHLLSTASYTTGSEESAANNLKRLASSLIRSTPMQIRFWQVQLHRQNKMFFFFSGERNLRVC